MHMADQVGTLEPGKLADLLIVDGDPLADIGILQGPREAADDHAGRARAQERT